MAVPFRILEQIDPETREQLLAEHRQIEFPAGHQLIFQADWGGEVYLVESGLAKARCLSLNGDEVVLSLIGSGALIGDLALLSPKPVRTVDVVALTAMTVMKLRQGALEEALKSSASFSKALTYLQVQRLCNLGNRLMLMNEDATTRLLYTLQLLASINSPDGNPCLPLPLIRAAAAGLGWQEGPPCSPPQPLCGPLVAAARPAARPPPAGGRARGPDPPGGRRSRGHLGRGRRGPGG